MQTWMEAWIRQLAACVEGASGAVVTMTSAEEAPPFQGPAVRCTVTVEGALRGQLHLSALESDVVQCAQLARRGPLDGQVALDSVLLTAWQGIIEESAAQLARELQKDAGETVSVTVGETRPFDSGHLQGADLPPEDSSATYALHAGQAALYFVLHEHREARPATKEQAEQAMVGAAGPTVGASPTQTPPGPTSSGADTAEGPETGDRQEERPMQDAERPPFQARPDRLDLLLDIELEATLRFGSTELPLRQVLELGPGDVLQLDRHVREPVDLVVGDRIVARGEVVLVDGNFGLQVTEVAEPRRRLETIRCLF